MKPLAHLYFVIPSQHRDAFHAGYASRLAPILARHGIVPTFDAEHSVAQKEKEEFYFFSLYFEVDGLEEVAARDGRLRQDPDWQEALKAFGEVIEYYILGLYRTPAGPGRAVPAGPGTTTPAGAGTTTRVGSGFWQGLWQSYGLLDGMPAGISDILQHSSGDLFLATREYATDLGRGQGLWRFDGVELQRWSPADGLPSDQVICLCQDGQGPVWIGTEGGGLVCYDGHTFTTYTTADGLADNVVSALLIDPSGQLWMGTPGGLCRFDGETFTTYSTADGLVYEKIARLLQDGQGRLWFGGGWAQHSHLGLGCFDGETFTYYTQAEGLPMNWILSLLEDRSGTLWFGQSWCLSRFDGQRFERVLTTDTTRHLGGVTALLEEEGGPLFFATWGEGLRRYDGKVGPAFTPQDGLAGANVLSLLQDRDGQVWVGTLGAGLSRYSGPRLETFGVEEGLAHRSIRSLVADGQGRLWISTSRGLNYYQDDGFATIEDTEGNIGALLHDRQGRLWFSAIGWGLGCYDGRRVEVLRFAESPRSAVEQIIPLLEDEKGRLFFAEGGDQGGLCLLDENGPEKKLVQFETDIGVDPRSVRCMLQDGQGRLWFGGSEGLVLLDGGQVRCFTPADGLGEEAILALLEDRQGRLWIGTDGDGLYYRDDEAMTRFDTAAGLAHNQVKALLEDAHGHLWIGTAGGVSRYDGRIFQHLSRRDGLPDDDIRTLHQDGEGALWIGTGNGLARYRPAVHPPTVRLTALIADRHHAPDESIVVPTAQRLIAVEFQGFSLTTPPERLAYWCRLKGRDADWYPLYANRAEYRDLPEGDYVFQVQAIDRDLNYSEVARIRFSVEPDARLQSLTAALEQSGPQGEFVGHSPALQRVQQQLRQVAPADLTVLILGETGTGKGLAARTLHQLSPRRREPLVQVHCGALPDALIESELFGHEKGAFTGATSRHLGKVELAQGGTLFLDEIGDMSPSAQLRLLRLLEERKFERVGGTQVLEAEVRVVAATNRDLQRRVEEGSFRQDLYYRLLGFEIHLPPLRERREDIPLLASYFIGPMAAHLDRPISGLSKAAEAALVAHEWPGNVRELQRVIDSAVVVCQGSIIEVEDLKLGQGPSAPPAGGPLTLVEMERRHIQAVLEKTGGRVSGPQGAAKLLGLHESTLRARMRKLGIKPR